MGFPKMSRPSDGAALYRQMGTMRGRVSMSSKEVRATVNNPGLQSLDEGILSQIGMH